MSKSINFKKLLVISLSASVMMVAAHVQAHTRLETATVKEGVTVGHSQVGRVHNYVRISHGCPPNDDRRSSMGTSVIFPNAISYTPVIGINSGNGTEYTTQPASDFYSPLAGIGTLNRTGQPWDLMNNKTDPLGNKDGFWIGGTPYDQTVSTVVSVDFDTNAVSINSESCARKVVFNLAIADFCELVPSAQAHDEHILYWSPIPKFSGVPGGPFGAPTADEGRGIPVGPAYSNYDGYADAAHTIAGDGWGSPATLTVERDKESNPLPESCTGNEGQGDDVYVYPSAEQINTEMPIWSNHDQTGINYWQ